MSILSRLQEVFSKDNKKARVVAPEPLKIIKYELEQLNGFYQDLEELVNEYPDLNYEREFKDLRDKTDYLRAEYSALYAKILTDNPDIKNDMG